MKKQIVFNNNTCEIIENFTVHYTEKEMMLQIPEYNNGELLKLKEQCEDGFKRKGWLFTENEEFTRALNELEFDIKFEEKRVEEKTTGKEIALTACFRVYDAKENLEGGFYAGSFETYILLRKDFKKLAPRTKLITSDFVKFCSDRLQEKQQTLDNDICAVLDITKRLEDVVQNHPVKDLMGFNSMLRDLERLRET